MFLEIENYMLKMMKDSAHDCEHIYRVLYMALEIANYEENVDYDVLIAACLLHDIGRERQFKDPTLCHAFEGSIMAYEFLLKNHWTDESATKVKECITRHRYRNGDVPRSIEEKILFDSDKLDVSGAIGIARTIQYGSEINEPLYTLDAQGNVLNGNNEGEKDSFFREFHYKLKGIYDKFYTKRAKEIGIERERAALEFYSNLLKEVKDSHENGMKHLKKHLEN